MLLITAEWILPVSGPPIHAGAVAVDGDVVVAVGAAERLAGEYPTAKRTDFPGCVVSPGLVNAHTHLVLSSLEGALAPAPFIEWLPELVAAVRSWSHEDFCASAALGAQRCIEAGVTVVGDIVYGRESLEAAAAAGIGGAFYWEVLGIQAEGLHAHLQTAGFPEVGACTGRVRCGLSPHSTYTSGPALLAATHALARELRAPFAIHAAESAAEVELVSRGTGPLASLADRMAPDLGVRGTTPIAYLAGLGVLHGAVAVHAGHATPGDITLLAAHALGVVTCPRSNRYLSNPVAHVAEMTAAGVPVAVGTDSSASNHDLDLMEELRALQSQDATLEPRALIEMATRTGAFVLGLGDRFGAIEPGMRADLAIFDLGQVADVEADFVSRAVRTTLAAVMSSGVWRTGDRVTSRFGD